MMAQMIMKNRKQTVNTGKMFKWDICEKSMQQGHESNAGAIEFKWDICEKSMRYVPDIKGNGTYVEKIM